MAGWPKLGRRREESGDRAPGTVKVSVVVAVYNPGKYIEPCIVSLLNQSLPAGEYEVIFVDDGSTDATPARLDEIAAQHDNVTAIHIPNSGWPGKPRNVGMKAAVGEYVYFVDHDDYLTDEALERMYDMAHRNGADVIIGKIVGHGRRVPPTLFRQNYERCTLETAPLMESMTPHKGFRRAFLDAHGIRFPEGRRRLEDHVFVVEAYLLADVVSVLADYTCYHHIARPDAGNAGFDRIVPRGYFGNLREGIDIVERLTEPGALRDLVLRRWYKVEMLNRVGAKAFARYSPEYRREMYDEIRALAIERFTSPGIWAELGPQYRVRSALLRADRFDDLLTLAEFEAGLVLGCRLESVDWAAGSLTLDLSLAVETADGTPAMVTDGVSSPRFNCPVADVPDDALTVAAVLEQPRAEVLFRHRDTKDQYVLPTDLQSPTETARPGSGVEYRARCAFDPTSRAGSALRTGVWDIFVRLAEWGAGSSLTRRVGANRAPTVEGPLRPAILGTPSRPAIPYWTDQGNLSVDLDQKTRSLTAAVRDSLGKPAVSKDAYGFLVCVPLTVHVGPGAAPLAARLHAVGPGGDVEVCVRAAIGDLGGQTSVQGQFPGFTPDWELAVDVPADREAAEMTWLGSTLHRAGG